MTGDKAERLRRRPRIAVIGTVGVPGNYGGFETLAANLVDYHRDKGLAGELEVYCSKPAYSEREGSYHGARLHYVPLGANGVSSIAYDIVSMLWAVLRRSDVVLVLGVSGAIFLPIAKLLSRANFVVNIDGIEWRREKWSRAASWFLRLSEGFAVRFADIVVADNRGIVDYVSERYGRAAEEIAYGGDHAVACGRGADEPSSENDAHYGLMLCRIEPENNIHVILEAFAQRADQRLVAVGNWNASEYGRDLRVKFGAAANLALMDPVFEPDRLYSLRRGAAYYVHGHSAGGTNPSLVEMMHFAIPVIAYDCVYNRQTTEDAAIYFQDSASLAASLSDARGPDSSRQAARMQEIAERRYRWDTIGRQYFDLLL